MLGFVVHPGESVLTPSHTITYLGFEINSSHKTITLTREKKEKIYSSASKLLIWVQFLHGHQTVQCGAANAEVKVHLKRTQSLKVLSFGVGQYIALHATLTAMDFFLAYFYISDPFTCIFFPKPLPIFPVLAVANTWFLCRSAD